MKKQTVMDTNWKRKKRVYGGIAFGILMSLLLLFSFAAVNAKQQSPTVEINGVGVYSTLSRTNNGQTWVDVDAFFHVLKGTYQLENRGRTLTYKGNKIPVERYKDGTIAKVQDLAKVINAEQLTKNQDGSYYILVLPKGTVQISPVVPQMGEHWTNPNEDILYLGNDDPVFKAIYGVYQGKLVFIEQMISQKYLVQGKSFTNFAGMKGLPSPAIDHSNIEFVPQGHEGYEIPHYDIHHYFISPEERDQIGMGGGHPH